MINKKLAVFIFLCLVFSSCRNNDDKIFYEGYHNAWDKKKDESRYKTEMLYQRGYDKGAKDSAHFFQGCDDAEKDRFRDNRLMKYEWYDKGYQECKKN